MACPAIRIRTAGSAVGLQAPGVRGSLEQFQGAWNLAGAMGFASLNPSYASAAVPPGRMG
jgi:hypothetical protein